ncbi:hypothetical protein ABH922_005166 [Rhodococcus sp. 27YEA15]|uniref:hypothetical protein n=1 Tax=Rhodococcus sp. 27YEA15 TaxID=3156259 RepID=UPI003C7A07DB
MNSYPDRQKVVDDLGEKFLDAFVASVDKARADLEEFRDFRPEWFVNFSKRFVAGFIHERIWDSMLRTADEGDIHFKDDEPTREIHIGTNYVVRIKRHTENLKITSYPTTGALAFWTNSATAQLPDLELWSLAMGYIWNPEEAAIGDTILSFRDSKDTPIWSILLHSGQSGQATGITWTPVDPQLPQLDLSDVVATSEDTVEGS